MSSSITYIFTTDHQEFCYTWGGEDVIETATWRPNMTGHVMVSRIGGRVLITNTTVTKHFTISVRMPGPAGSVSRIRVMSFMSRRWSIRVCPTPRLQSSTLEHRKANSRWIFRNIYKKYMHTHFINIDIPHRQYFTLFCLPIFRGKEEPYQTRLYQPLSLSLLSGQL